MANYRSGRINEELKRELIIENYNNVIEVYNENDQKDEIQYLQIDDVKYGEKTLFKAYFKTDNAKYCSIDIVDKDN